MTRPRITRREKRFAARKRLAGSGTYNRLRRKRNKRDLRGRSTGSPASRIDAETFPV